MDKHEADTIDQLHPAPLASSGQYAINDRKEQVTVLGTMGQDPDIKPKVPWKVWAIVGLCCLASFQNVFLGIAPAAGAYGIAGALNGMDTRIWIVQAQSVPSIATGPIFAIVADIYGRRYVVLGVWALLCVAAIVSMTAQGMSQMIIGQTLAGVGAGISGIMFAIASEVAPSYYRSHIQTAINAISGLSAVMALVGIGGISTIDKANGWRWIFRFLLICDAITLIGFAILYHPPPRTRSRKTTIEKIKGMDWIGYTLLLGGLVPLLLGFAYSGDMAYGWKSAHSYVPVAVGFAGFAACLLWEWKGTSTGFLDHRLFMDGRNFPLAIFIIAVEGSLFYLVNNIYSGQVFGLWAPTEPAVQQGARLLPFFLVISVISPFLSIYVTKRKDIKWPLCAGFLFFSAAVIGFALSGTNGNLALVFNALGGIGFAAPLILVMTLVQLSTPPLFIGTASALTISARTLGGTVGYAMADAIFKSKTTNQVPAAIAATALSMGFNPANLTQLIIAVLSHQGLDKVPGITGPIIGAVMGEVAKVNAHGYKITWFAFLPATFIAAIACAFLKNPKDRMNWIVDAPLDSTKESDTVEMANSEAATDEKESTQQFERQS